MSWPIVDLTFWSPGDPQSDAIDALLADPGTPLAKHGLTGIASAYARETRAELHDLHKEWDAHLAGRSLGVDGALAEIAPLFRDAAVPYFVAKGPAIAHTLYPNAGFRPYCDLDVYVPPASDELARSLLRSAGYAPVEHGVGALGGLAREMHGGAYSATVEVHNHLIDNLHRHHLPPIESFLERVEHRVIAGVNVPVPDAATHLALQAIHAAAGHRYSKLILLRDIELAGPIDAPAALGADTYLTALRRLLLVLGRRVDVADSARGTLQGLLISSLLRTDPLSWDEYRLSMANVLGFLHQERWALTATCAARGAVSLVPRRSRRVDLRVSVRRGTGSSSRSSQQHSSPEPALNTTHRG